MRWSLKETLKLLQFYWNRSLFLRRVFLFVVVVAVLALLFLFHFAPAGVNLKAGQVASRDIVAPRTVEFVNQKETEEARRKAARSVGPVYSLHYDLVESAIARLHFLFHEARKRKEASVLGEHTLNHLEETASQMARFLLEDGITEEKLPDAKKRAKSLVNGLHLPPVESGLLYDSVSEVLMPTLLPDWNLMVKEQERRMVAVGPVKTLIQKGQVIIHKGDLVTPKHLEALAALGLTSPALDLSSVGALAILTLTIIALFWFYLVRFCPRIVANEKLLLLFTLVLLVSASLCKVAVGFSGYVAPVAMAAMLVSILLDAQLGIFSALILSCLVGLLTGDFRFLLALLVGGVVSVFSVSRVTKRSDLTGATLVISLATVATIVVFSLLGGDDLKTFLMQGAFGLLNGLLSVVLCLGLLPFLEHTFGVTTSFRLLELSNPNEPLLRKLLVEAPGTYHHSIIVANLAENAAREVGADPLLARVGAYYHDVGKLRRPYFFVENQMGGENPHDKLTPTLSTLIVTAHTRDGNEMAKEHRIPEAVRDFVVQHHGTTMVTYFYHQAVTREGAQNVPADDFRHTGPKPQTKETAIVMLADEVEAATRSLVKPTPQKIEMTVKEIIKHCMNDGQLDECQLSFRDVAAVRESFITILNGMYHTRIEYPDKEALREFAEHQARGGKVLKLKGRDG